MGALLQSCLNHSELNYELPDQAVVEALLFHSDSIRIVGDPGEFKVEKTITSVQEGIQLLTFEFTSETPAELQLI